MADVVALVVHARSRVGAAAGMRLAELRGRAARWKRQRRRDGGGGQEPGRSLHLILLVRGGVSEASLFLSRRTAQPAGQQPLRAQQHDDQKQEAVEAGGDLREVEVEAD